MNLPKLPKLHKGLTDRLPLALSFALPFLGMLILMIASRYTPFGNHAMLYSDMWHQYYPFFVNFRSALRSGNSLLYNWHIGMGLDYLGLFAYYLSSPLNLLAVFVPEASVLDFFSLLVPLKMGFASLFFAYFLKKIFGKDTETPVVNAADITPIQEKIDASMPETATVTVHFKSTLGELNSTYVVTYNTDGTATVSYTYEKFNAIGEGKNVKDSLTGETVIGANGELTTPAEGIAAVEALTFDINLDAAKLASVEVTAGVLTATVKAANTASVLGVDLGVDASVVVSTNASVVEFIAISYVSAAGPVEITAMYTYSAE
jgi:hypothetical protein